VREAFFENPIYVYLSLLVAVLVLLAIWYETRSRRVLLGMLIPVVLGILVATIEHLVVTDREQIVEASGEIAAAVQTRQLERIPPYIDEDFSAFLPLISLSLTKDGVVDACNRQILGRDIRSVKLGRTEVEVRGKTATMHAMTMVHYGTAAARKTPLVWEVVWVKRQDGWRVLKVTDLRQGVRF